MFEPGKIYNRRSEIHGIYGGQSQSGISTPADYPVIFIFTGESGKAYGYEDKYRADGVFWYTGEGQTGDMTMVRGNKAIPDHVQDGKTIHLFEYVGTGRVRYVGVATYLGHHIEERPDVDNQLRKAIVFELEVDPSTVTSQQESGHSVTKSSEGVSMWKQPLEDLRRLALTSPSKNSTSQERRTITWQRSEAVRVYALRRAQGICEGCSRPAPFKTRERRHYLEPHHIRRIADGGPDDPRWVAALCPNCHREVHYGENGEDLNRQLADNLNSIETEIVSS